MKMMPSGKNIITILIDGGRLDRARKSKVFTNLNSVFSRKQLLMHHTQQVQCMLLSAVYMDIEAVQIVIGTYLNLKK